MNKFFRCLCLMLALVVLPLGALAAVRMPARRGAVPDDADVLSAQTAADLTEYAELLSDSDDSIGLHVAIVHFLDGLDAQTYADQLFDKWDLDSRDLLVLVAAISSAISLVEVVVTFFLDRAAAKGKQGNRHRIVLLVCLAIMVEAALVAVDGLGSNGIWVPGQASFGIQGWNECWLDFMDCLSEGLAMPLGALLMSIMIGWEIGSKTVLEEVHKSSSVKWINGFLTFCLMVVVPLAMAFILGGQIGDYFTTDPETQGQTVYYIGYGIGAVIVVLAWIAAYTSPKRKAS